MHVFVTKNSEKQTAGRGSGFNKHLNQNLYTESTIIFMNIQYFIPTTWKPIYAGFPR